MTPLAAVQARISRLSASLRRPTPRARAPVRRADERPLERWDDGSTPPGSPEPVRAKVPGRGR